MEFDSDLSEEDENFMNNNDFGMGSSSRDFSKVKSSVIFTGDEEEEKVKTKEPDAISLVMKNAKEIANMMMQL